MRHLVEAADEHTRAHLPTRESLLRMLKDWESGRRRPRDPYPLLLCRVFDITEAELFGEAGHEIARRDVLALGAAAGTGLIPSPERRGPIAPELVDYFQAQLTGHYQADMMLGPLDLIDTVSAQYGLIERLLESAQEPTRQRLAEVGTAYGAFCGWLYLDAGDAEQASRWHGVALEMAHRSGNAEAVSCTLVDLAMARTDQGSGAAVVDLCANALRNARLGPEVRVFALQQQAHGASLLRDRTRVDRLLDEAGNLVERVDHEQWGTACRRTPKYVEVQRATCYGRLGLAEEADLLWGQIIPAGSGSSRRDVGVWTARHATVKALTGEPEHAVDLARTAVPIALGTGSARAGRELVALKDAMRPWQDAPVGQELTAILAPGR